MCLWACVCLCFECGWLIYIYNVHCTIPCAVNADIRAVLEWICASNSFIHGFTMYWQRLRLFIIYYDFIVPTTIFILRFFFVWLFFAFFPWFFFSFPLFVSCFGFFLIIKLSCFFCFGLVLNTRYFFCQYFIGLKLNQRFFFIRDRIKIFLRTCKINHNIRCCYTVFPCLKWKMLLKIVNANVQCTFHSIRIDKNRSGDVYLFILHNSYIILSMCVCVRSFFGFGFFFFDMTLFATIRFSFELSDLMTWNMQRISVDLLLKHKSISLSDDDDE